MNLQIDTTAFSNEELLAEIAKLKPQLSRKLKSESTAGFSATKEDYSNVVAFYNALVAEARLRGLALPGGSVRRSRCWTVPARVIGPIC